MTESVLLASESAVTYRRRNRGKIRTAAVAQLLEEESLRAVARRTGINRSTISKTHRAWNPTLTSFARLTEKEAW